MEISKLCDVLVYGSTPGGIACAVRAAREGLRVVLVTHAKHAGGMLANGLSTMDTLYKGERAPLYDELRAAIHEYYRTAYGENSEPYQSSLPGQAKTKFEAHVAEKLCEEMLAREPGIEVFKGFYPVGAEREERLLTSITFEAMTGTGQLVVESRAFADCSYEADLAMVAGVEYRVGRESREEFGEAHAGVIFMRRVPWPPEHVDAAYLAEYQKLNLVHYKRWYEIIQPESTGAADPAVQAFNMRTVLTRNPEIRVLIAEPESYDREALLQRLQIDVNWSYNVPDTPVPNGKTYWNLPELLGPQNHYVEGDWDTRRQVTEEHIRLTLHLLYFLQNDESVPEEIRCRWREWGLPKDEFPDNGHMPYETYVRETRRIKGRRVFTENDSHLVPGVKRAPVHRDSIGITEWFLDSHACTPQKLSNSLWEGELLLNNITFPGQISLQTLMPEELDNLLVPVCLSSSHVGWGAIRLEPTWMALGEAAAWAFVLAQRSGVAPAESDPDELLRQLAGQGIMISFFNDVEQHTQESWYAAVQYLGTQGYFGSYNALPGDPLRKPLAAVWASLTAERRQGVNYDASAAASGVWQAEQQSGESIVATEFARLLDAACDTDNYSQQLVTLDVAGSEPITRAEACRLIYSVEVAPP